MPYLRRLALGACQRNVSQHSIHIALFHLARKHLLVYSCVLVTLSGIALARSRWFRIRHSSRAGTGGCQCRHLQPYGHSRRPENAEHLLLQHNFEAGCNCTATRLHYCCNQALCQRRVHHVHVLGAYARQQIALKICMLTWSGAVQSMLSATSYIKAIQARDDVDAVEEEIQKVQSNLSTCVRMCDPWTLCTCEM